MPNGPDFSTLAPVTDGSKSFELTPDFGSLKPIAAKVPDFKSLKPVTPRAAPLNLEEPAPPRDSMERAARDYYMPKQEMPKAAVNINPDDFNTPLPRVKQAAFKVWKQQNAPNDDGSDYDYQGAFLAGVKPAANGHWPDTFKKPNEPTFSTESIYAKQFPQLAGKWSGDNFAPPPNKPAVNTPADFQREQQYEQAARDEAAKHEGLITSLPRATVADIAAGFAAAPQYSGNIPAAVTGRKLPIDQVIENITKDDPKAAAFSKASQDVAAQAPQFLLPFGTLPKLAQRAVAGAFTFLMLHNAKPIADALGDEYGKPEEQRDPEKIRDLWAQAIETSGFAAAGGYGAARAGIAKESPALQKLFTKTITESYTPQELKGIFQRVTTGKATPEEDNLYRTISSYVSSPGQAVRQGATLSTTVPRFDYLALSRYLGLPDRTFAVKIAGEPSTKEDYANAQGPKPENGIQKYLGIPQGENLPAHIEEVRQEEGGPPSGGGGAELSPTQRGPVNAPELAPTKLTPHDLEPAIIVNGQPVTASSALVHRDIVDDAVKSNSPQAPDIVMAAAADKNHVFVDPNNNILTRDQASTALGLKQPLHSEGLNRLKGPSPDWQVTVQAASGEVPGYVQIDKVEGGKNIWSASPETLTKKGFEIPDFSKLPQGKYSFSKAQELVGNAVTSELVPVPKDPKSGVALGSGTARRIFYDGKPTRLLVLSRNRKAGWEGIYEKPDGSFGASFGGRNISQVHENAKAVIKKMVQSGQDLFLPSELSKESASTTKSSEISSKLVVEPLNATNLGYSSARAFERDYKANSLKAYNETRDEFMKRRHCSGTVPAPSKASKAYQKRKEVPA